MKFYLSSYKLGNSTAALKSWLATSQKRVGYIPNALDFIGADSERVAEHIFADMNSLKDLGFQVELLDLKTYFGKEGALHAKLEKLDMIWVSGGNTFVLRQAMRLSGFDTVFLQMQERDDFVYGAYSAGCCVLSPTLRGLQIVDDPNNHPYKGCSETIWEGLGILDYIFLPHFDSDHPESADIAKEVEYCKANELPFRTVRDGEVVMIES